MCKDREYSLLVDDTKMCGLKLNVRGDVPCATLRLRVRTEADTAAFIDMSATEMIRVGKLLVREGEKMKRRGE